MTRYSATDWGLLLLRLGFAALLIGLHGWTRLLRAFNFVVHGTPWTFVDLVGRLGFPFPPAFAVASALSESAAVTLIAIGLFTRPAAAIVAFNMAVAFYNEAGKGDPFELPGAVPAARARRGGRRPRARSQWIAAAPPARQKVKRRRRFSSSFFASSAGILPSAAKSANGPLSRPELDYRSRFLGVNAADQDEIVLDRLVHVDLAVVAQQVVFDRAVVVVVDLRPAGDHLVDDLLPLDLVFARHDPLRRVAQHADPLERVRARSRGQRHLLTGRRRRARSGPPGQVPRPRPTRSSPRHMPPRTSWLPARSRSFEYEASAFTQYAGAVAHVTRPRRKTARRRAPPPPSQTMARERGQSARNRRHGRVPEPRRAPPDREV